MLSGEATEKKVASRNGRGTKTRSVQRDTPARELAVRGRHTEYSRIHVTFRLLDGSNFFTRARAKQSFPGYYSAALAAPMSNFSSRGLLLPSSFAGIRKKAIGSDNRVSSSRASQVIFAKSRPVDVYAYAKRARWRLSSDTGLDLSPRAREPPLKFIQGVPLTGVRLYSSARDTFDVGSAMIRVLYNAKRSLGITRNL